MLDKIPHYSLTNPASIYNEEALTALELAGRTAAKANETVEAFNKLEEDTDKKLSEQDEFIDEMNAVTMPKLVKDTVKEHIDDGEFDEAIDEYAGQIKTRVDNLVSGLPEGSTTMDAEVVDVRVAADGRSFSSAGEAVREQNKTADRRAILLDTTSINGYLVDDGVTILSALNEIYLPKNAIVYVGKTQIIYPEARINYTHITKSTFYVVVPFKYTKYEGVYQLVGDGDPIAIERENYDASKHAILFVVNKNTFIDIDKGISPLTPPVAHLNVDSKVLNYRTPAPKIAQKIFVKDDMVEFNTKNKTVEIKHTLLCCYGDIEFSITPTVLSYDVGDNTVYLLYDLQSGNVFVKPVTDYERFANRVIVMQFQTNYLTTPAAQNIGAPYVVDGKTYGGSTGSSSDTPTVIVKGNESVYVDGVNGSDENTGALDSPYKTIQKAIDSGAVNIYITAGTYKEKLSASNRANLNLTAYPSGKVVIDGGVYVSGEVNDTDNGKKAHTINFIANAGSNAEKVMQGALSNVVTGERSNGYYITVWCYCDGYFGAYDEKMTFYNSREEFTSNYADTGWFIENGNIIVIHNYDFDIPNICIVTYENGSVFENIGKLTLNNIDFIHNANDAATIKNCPDVHINACEFSKSSLGNGLYLENVSGEISLCKAEYNRNDGFNLHGKGYTVFNECDANHNADDGISHHNGCHGVINGGRYAINSKAGIAPTYKASVQINNAYIYGNYTYGILASDPDYTEEDSYKNVEITPIQVRGCYISGNKTGIYSRNYDVFVFNSAVKSGGVASTEMVDYGVITEINVTK